MAKIIGYNFAKCYFTNDDDTIVSEEKTEVFAINSTVIYHLNGFNVNKAVRPDGMLPLVLEECNLELFT